MTHFMDRPKKRLSPKLDALERTLLAALDAGLSVEFRPDPVFTSGRTIEIVCRRENHRHLYRADREAVELANISIFAESVERCHRGLENGVPMKPSVPTPNESEERKK